MAVVGQGIIRVLVIVKPGNGHHADHHHVDHLHLVLATTTGTSEAGETALTLHVDMGAIVMTLVIEHQNIDVMILAVILNTPIPIAGSVELSTVLTTIVTLDMMRMPQTVGMKAIRMSILTKVRSQAAIAVGVQSSELVLATIAPRHHCEAHVQRQ